MSRLRKHRPVRKKRRHLGLTLLFSSVIFVVILVALAVGAAVVFLVTHLGLLEAAVSGPRYLLQSMLLMVVVSTVVGFLIALLASRIPLSPIKRLIDRMNQLASGDFQARMEFEPPIRDIPSFSELSESFNTMATELESTELLRTDFINNFSHEFKTPIVSIAGFAKLLKRGKLSPEQQAEYLDIIESESLRLARMATNVLNLTKIENQSILTEVTEFNLSEQVRTCILLFIDQMEQKNLEIQAEFGEFTITADEELLKQIWINLMSNAVKFSPEWGSIAVEMQGQPEQLSVTIRNSGDTIPPAQQKKIFRKFYQADESHAAEGNGIGLAIVKRVAELHHGTVTVQSENGVTAFTVTLPRQEKQAG